MQEHPHFAHITNMFLYLLAQERICAFLIININSTPSSRPTSTRIPLYFRRQARLLAEPHSPSTRVTAFNYTESSLSEWFESTCNKRQSLVHREQQPIVCLVRTKRHLHVSGIAKVYAALVGPLVAAILKTDHALACTHLFFGEVANVLLGFLRANARLAKITGLKTWIELTNS